MDFIRIANFNNKLEAETVAHVLDAADLPFVIHSDEALFGEGGIGEYVFLSVPADRVDEARDLLSGLTGGASEA
jgi:hypothetical protein